MLRLTVVFLLWVGSTAHSLEPREAQLQEATELEWLEADPVHRALLERADRDWYHYRRLTRSDAHTTLPAGDDCPHHERAKRR